MKYYLKFTLLLFLLTLNCTNTFAYEKSDKIEKISKNLRCLICQGQSVYDSQSDFALSVKDLIKNKLENGNTEDEIYKYLQTKYGDWILYEPKINKNTIILWGLPLILFIFGGLLIFRKAFIK
tara:strand:+ start:477 stop:845 length:369 start_codon:yes stop_codon:yes gene_type:complete